MAFALPVAVGHGELPSSETHGDELSPLSQAKGRASCQVRISRSVKQPLTPKKPFFILGLSNAPQNQKKSAKIRDFFMRICSAKWPITNK
jgi:hypothetical protein